MSMTDTDIPYAPAPLLAHVSGWSDPARSTLWSLRILFHDVAAAADIGRLDETLKWGQPSWRPVKPRMGSTLRMAWDATQPDQLSLFVDCKTDLAARMRDLYPQLPLNDGQRQLGIDLTQPLPEQALRHLAEMTFGYHRAKRQV